MGGGRRAMRKTDNDKYNCGWIHVKCALINSVSLAARSERNKPAARPNSAAPAVRTCHMEMKKVFFAALVAAASATTVLASEAPAGAPGPATSGASAAAAAPVALVVSFLAYYLHH
ncbi:hypothetical protein ZWY2020_001984 [Hordeum vulgare]|nr:hypothetical protein ZWY2020_001984 [Hordeum vulgare]